ncbi:MAG TPA: chloride channel protein [Acidisoma sp.]|jgi:H+/Cl- antiporter ClcA|uniref:chloride channel protein n=1 Tax=Acidisoma sp. TaxID=1872115 RepID=UPI002BBB9C6C|nr:chloride channel protein [Acidisoma sp.]HTI01240.1 chloride channel protein [Acidisoma sp.]
MRLDRRSLRFWRQLPLTSPRLWTRRLAFWAGAGLVALVAIAFARLADGAQDLFNFATAGRSWLVLIIAPCGFALSVYLTRTVFPGAQGSGIPQVMAALQMTDSRMIERVLSLRVGLGKILLTLLGLASGASIGREGPTVQVGASIMQALGRALRLPRVETQRGLVLAGGAAGVAAAFNTPLAGVVFAIEELSHSFESRTSGMVLTAVILGGIATLALTGNYTYFGVTSVGLPLGSGWIAVILCGLIGGLLGGVFSSLLLALPRNLPGRVGGWVKTHPIQFAGLCGLGIAILGIASHGATYGTGYAQARALVEGDSRLPVTFFILKFLATVFSYLSGIPGGIFAPSLSVGASLGSWLAQFFPHSPARAIVLLGMVGYFAGVVQAPITAFVIVLEMTANQQMTIPIMATAWLGYAASRLVCRRPLYGSLARRFLKDTVAAARAIAPQSAVTATVSVTKPQEH